MELRQTVDTYSKYVSCLLMTALDAGRGERCFHTDRWCRLRMCVVYACSAIVPDRRNELVMVQTYDGLFLCLNILVRQETEVWVVFV